jgi:hypothetical protein
MKKFLCAAILCCILSSPMAFAENDGTLIMCAMESQYISVNGEIKNTDVAPFLYDSTTYLPIRAISEGFGADVSYNGEENTVTVTFNGQTRIFDIAEGINYNDRVYLPARKMMESLGLTIEWYDGLISISDSDSILNEASIIKAKSDLKYIGHKDRKFDYKITFSKSAGFYTEDFRLRLSTEMPDATIHYTTDGSEPDENSPVYSDPIEIKDRTFDNNTISLIRTADEDFIAPISKVFKGTTIKAKAFDSMGNSTPTVVNSYFVAKNIFTRYGVTVVSITTPQENLFDSNTGIYVPPNYTNKGSDWEREAYMEVFDSDGNRTISQTVGLRINGAFTRKYQQKSLRVYARENTEYRNGDKKKFKYDFFNGTVIDSEGENIDSYKTILLRNSGDDWYNYFIRDALVQEIAKPLNVDTSAYEPAVVFINGEYWGVHEIRERYDDNYFKSHYNLSSTDDVAMIEISEDRDTADLSEGEQSDLDEFNDEFSFVINTDMSLDENYQQACEYFDIDNLIDYYAVNIYFENNDWPFNNIKIWKNKNEENNIDCRWRWVLSDMDGTFESLQNNVLYTGSIGRKALERWSVDQTGALGYLLEDEPCLMQKFITSLLQNSTFREQFETRYRECIENYFSYDKISPIIDSLTKTIEPLRAEHRLRYPNSWNMPKYTNLFSYADSRQQSALNEIENYFK